MLPGTAPACPAGTRPARLDVLTADGALRLPALPVPAVAAGGSWGIEFEIVALDLDDAVVVRAPVSAVNTRGS